ncbi:MAG: hypothetical protein HW421_2775 [Ignavibacteria bacterium]|nr:hypothetical protein [Ignavibacteria bacterium]
MMILNCTCANYISKVLTLADSIKKVDPNMKFSVCLLEKEIHPAIKDYPNIDNVYLAKDIGFDNFEHFMFKYHIVEGSCAIKGQFFRFIMDTFPEEEKIVFIDPDIMIISPMEELDRALNHYDIVLSPHLTIPEKKETKRITMDAIRDNELSASKYGAYNLGFLGLRNSYEGRKLADWWACRLDMFCYEELWNGIWNDQKWLDLAPCFFNTFVLRHPGYDAAPWNMSMRRITHHNGNWHINGEPLRFFHFTGFDSGANEAMMNKYAPGSADPVFMLREEYVDMLNQHDQTEIRKTPWSYDYFDSGEKIEFETRKLYREVLMDSIEKPFAMSNKEITEPSLEGLSLIDDWTYFNVDMLSGKTITNPEEVVEVQVKEPQITVVGWAIDRLVNRLAGGVYLEVDGVMYPTFYGNYRPDIVKSFGVEEYIKAGFLTNIPLKKLGLGRHELMVKVLAFDKKSYFAGSQKFIFNVEMDSNFIYKK